MQWHHVFCRSDAALPPDELADYIGDCWYGDDLPEIASASHRLVDEFPGSRRLELLVDTEPAAVAALTGEFLSPELDLLRGTRQVVSIGFKPDRLDDDIWELLDQTQAFIATRLDGMLVIAGDGVYDRNLRLQISLRDA